MARPPRQTPGGYVYHVFNRGFLRSEIFVTDEDYAEFMYLMLKAQRKYSMRICGYCLMPNHWHLALWPAEDDIVPPFMQYISSLHVTKWRKRWGTSGHLYQGRYRSLPVQNEGYYLSLVKYIEQNPLRANLVPIAQQWRWSSAWQRSGKKSSLTLDPGPTHIPENWFEFVNQPQDEKQLEMIRKSIARSSPLGCKEWVERAAERMSLSSKIKPIGRPKRMEKTVNGA